VKEVAYSGDMTFYEILLDGTQTAVTVSARNEPGREVLAQGARARVAWDPRGIVAFGA
jgi:spermidine/putrescine transport system ATP-binding protein